MYCKYDLYERALENTERYFETLSRNQMVEATDWRHGGIMDIERGTVPTNIVGLAHTPGILYFLEASKYYMSEKAYTTAIMILDFFEHNLNPSGLLDFYMCNFQSAPDTSFAILPLAALYNFIKDKKTDDKGEFLKDRVYNLLIKMADGVLTGGFHTPNHRWVISAALSMVLNITGDKKYLTRINEFLAEGIDCDEEGEYTERSTGGYNHVNNSALIVIAQELHKPELLEFVRRNLMMMTYYIHTDFTVFTQNSIRQDQGKENIYLDMYLYQYLKVGYVLQDEQLLGVAKALQDNILEKGRGYPIGINTMIEEPEIFEIPDTIEAFTFKPYEKHFPKSAIARISHNDMTLSLLENKDTFIYLRHESVDMYIQGGIMFFNERHIKVHNMHAIENGFAMTYHGEGKYYLPFGKYQGTSDFKESDKSKREATPILSVDAVIEVIKTEKGFKVSIKSSGIEKVPVRLDIAVNKNAFVIGEGYAIRANGGGILMPEKGYVKAELGNCGIKVGPAISQTYITEGLFGSAPLAQDKYHIFFNLLTPIDYSFTIEPVRKFED